MNTERRITNFALRKFGCGFCGLVAALGLAVMSPVAGVTLVENGQPRAVIILPNASSPAAELGARILRDHLVQISGAELPIKQEGSIVGAPSREQAWILVGEGQKTKGMGFSSANLGPGGVFLCASNQVLALFGADEKTPSDPDGSRYAVTLFLEDQLGVRYLWPGESGKVVPQRKTITVADFRRSFTPMIKQRLIRNMGLGRISPAFAKQMEAPLKHLDFTLEQLKENYRAAGKTRSESGDWFGWQRLGGKLNISGGHAFGHFWEKYGKTHPDWFAVQNDGTRFQKYGDRARLCVSNPELIKAIAEEKIEEARKRPELAGLSLSPNDGSVNNYCKCEKCAALDAPNGRKIFLKEVINGQIREVPHVSLTDRYISFWNAIAEIVVGERPDLLLSVDAYSAYAAPPVLRKLHPNLVVRFVNLQYLDEKKRKGGLADWDQWVRWGNKMFLRPNLLLAGRYEGAPMVYVHKMAEDFRTLAHKGMVGTDFDSCIHNWAVHGINYYVAARLHWDPDLDVDAVLDDYCRAGFGEAGPVIRRLFDRLEALTNELAKGKMDAEDLNRDEVQRERAATPRTDCTLPFTPPVMVELKGLMREAHAKVLNDPAIQRRLKMLDLGLRWTEIEAKAHALLGNASPTNKEATCQLLDERYDLMRDIFQNNPLAVNVTFISIVGATRFNELGWKPKVMSK